MDELYQDRVKSFNHGLKKAGERFGQNEQNFQNIFSLGKATALPYQIKPW
jgi:hypothetical protein